MLKQVSTHCYMLESVEESKRWGRYTFLGFDPVLELKPWFLAGGMQPDNVQKAIAFFTPFGIDCSSGVETDGWKNPVKIRQIIENVHAFVPLKTEL